MTLPVLSTQPFVTFVKSSVTFVFERLRLNHRGHEGMHKGHKGFKAEG